MYLAIIAKFATHLAIVYAVYSVYLHSIKVGTTAQTGGNYNQQLCTVSIGK